MSEEKIIKHAENVLHVLKDKKKSWKNKALQFAEEIIVIIFAVSVTLMFHNWNDSVHERKIAREFLIGIKSDLENGADRAERTKNFFQPTIAYYDTVWHELATHKIDAAYIDSNSGYLINTIQYSFDEGRFEGFKSSGYLRLIENQVLLKHLMSLYTVSIPFQVESDRNIFETRAQEYTAYFGPKGVINFSDSTGYSIHASKLVNDPYFQFQISRYKNIFTERTGHLLELEKKMRELAAELGEEIKGS